MDTPKDYLCPITLQLMDMPVILIEDGRSYEKRELQRWLQNHNTSPTTNKDLKCKDFVINISLKNAIEEFREKQTKARHYEALTNTLLIKTGGLPTEFQDKKYSQLRIKICLLGNTAVGKTTIVRHLQFQDRISKGEYLATIGPDIVPLHLDRLFEDRFAVVINVFDLPGDIRHKDVWKHQYQCHGAILVCDITTPSTMKDIEDGWYPTLKKHGFYEFEGVVLCNKIDLAKDSEDQIFKDAERFSTKNNLSLFYTSALTGKNIKTMFNQLVLCILNNRALLAQLKENTRGTGSAGNTKQRDNAPSITIEPDDIILNEKTKGKRKPKGKKGNEQKKDSSCC